MSHDTIAWIFFIGFVFYMINLLFGGVVSDDDDENHDEEEDDDWAASSLNKNSPNYRYRNKDN